MIHQPLRLKSICGVTHWLTRRSSSESDHSALATDAHSGMVHTVTTGAANEADVEQIADLLHGRKIRCGPTRAPEARRRALIARSCSGTSPLARVTSPNCPTGARQSTYGLFGGAYGVTISRSLKQLRVVRI